MINAGDLDRRIAIRKPLKQQNEFGEEQKQFTDFITVWAKFIPLRGRELFQAQQISAEVTNKFIIRHRSDIDETMEIVFENRHYDIHNIAEIGRREGLEILAIYKQAKPV